MRRDRLVALGGAGKTCLGERFLASIGDGPHPGGVFVFSFYDDDRVEAFFERALAYTSLRDARRWARGAADALQAALRDEVAPHLVVLDGIEVLQGSGEAETTYGRVDDGALRRLLASAARGLAQARFLITSRFDLTDSAAWEGSGVSTVKLDALSDAESVELLGRWGLAGGQNELRALLERVNVPHALSVAMIGSYAGASSVAIPRASAASSSSGCSARRGSSPLRATTCKRVACSPCCRRTRVFVARGARRHREAGSLSCRCGDTLLQTIADHGGVVAGPLAGLAAAHGQEALHDAVLERMKTHHHQPPANLQNFFRLMQGINQFFQFRIHVNAQRLEGPRRRMGAVLGPLRPRCLLNRFDKIDRGDKR